jgi:putative membrane protein
MMFWDGGHWVFWQAWLMWMGMIAFWALVGWGIYALVRSSRPGDATSPSLPPTDARHILDSRLARGDVDVDEYRRLRDTLAETPGSNRAMSDK